MYLDDPRWASGADSAWLAMGTPVNRMVIQAVLRCDGPIDLVTLRRRIAERWVVPYPGFHQRARTPRSGLGPMRWIHDPVSITEHVREAALPAPHDDAAVLDHVSALMAAGLPDDRPLWAVDLLTGHRDGDSIIVLSLHHGLGDGAALTHLLHVLADETSFPDTPAVHTTPPRPVSSTWGSAREDFSILGRIGHTTAAGIARRLTRSSDTPDQIPDSGRALARGARYLAAPGPERPNPLRRSPIGTTKIARWSRTMSVDAVRAAAHRLGGTINDAVTAAVSGAVRDHAIDMRTTPVDVRAVVPVNLRRLDRPIAAELGNAFGLVLPRLPVTEPTMAGRVARIRQSMTTLRHTRQAEVTFAGIAGAGVTAPATARPLVHRYADSASLVLTNVTGPTTALHLTGRRIRDVLFWVPCSGPLGLGLSIHSYDGQLRLGVAADASMIGGTYGADRIIEHLDKNLVTLGT